MDDAANLKKASTRGLHHRAWVPLSSVARWGNEIQGEAYII
jgi:hypothetical protein